MPTLLVEIFGRRKIAVLSQRVVVGRAAGSEVRVEDRTVSRIHAWIAQDGDTFYFNDAGSRFGSRINGLLVHGRVALKDADQIRVGPAKLRFREKMSIPPGFELIDLDDARRQRPEGFIDCACGAPLWIPWDFAGEVGRCRYCKNNIDGTPRGKRGESAAASASVAIPSAATGTCGACHAEIGTGEASSSCPDCGVSFHANCWTENLGCSSYGCKQVGILDTARDEPAIEEIDSTPLEEPERDVAPPPQSVDWSYPMLAAALGSAVVGLLAFGIPPAICLIGIVIYRFKARQRLQRGLFIASTLIALIAIGAGAAFSWYWWLGGSPLGRVAFL